ncbi:condensation domain-containing protein [Streptomyces sp. NPDC059679]|uniref:condensation domain-containing protein n=1 Tax=Streptomyces sp. NPDC059679 TaxID=3346903 RepID=UPI0036C4AB34
MKDAAMPSPEGTAFSLSHAQRGLWLLKLLDDTGTEQNLPMWTDLGPGTNRERTEFALNFLIARHDALRLVFSTGPDGPRQSILPHYRFELPLSDLTSHADPAEEFDRQVRADNAKPFDFSRPLLRGCLFKLADVQFRLYLNVHHLISDGLSNAIVQRELTALVDMLEKGAPPDLPALPTSYESHVREEPAWLASPEGVASAAYWRAELRPPLPRLRLADGGRPATSPGGTPFASMTFHLDAETTAAARAAARGVRVTVNTLFMSAYAVALTQLTGDDDLIIGVPFSGRHSMELMELVGLFANMVAVRADLSGAVTFADATALVNEKSLRAYEHSRYPFDLAVEQANPRRDGGRNPTFLTIFQVAAFLPPEHMAPQVDVGFYGKPDADRFAFRVNYDTGRLTPERAAALAAAFRTVVARVTADPSVPLAELRPAAPAVSRAAVTRGGRLQRLIDARHRAREE